MKANVSNMTSPNGNKVPNQFIIKMEDGTLVFQSYQSVIGIKDKSGKLTLDKHFWDYSRTTAKYRNVFTGLTTEETKKKIASGEITLSNIN